MSSRDLIGGIPYPNIAGAKAETRPSEIERDVIRLFDQFRDPLLRYALSFGIPIHDAEEVIQETFLSLFRHLLLGKSQRNLRGWIFRVAHNLALKQRHANKRLGEKVEHDRAIAERQPDPVPNPEERFFFTQRRSNLLAVVAALSEADQSCLRLRAEGLRYREISAVVGISLGSVSISLTRSLTRLMRAEGR